MSVALAPQGQGTTEVASASAVGPSWLASRPRPILFGTVAVTVALVAGALASYNPEYAVGFVGAIALIVAVLMWPIFGACVLVGVVPATSGLQAGFPLPNLRLSEALIGVVGVTLIASVRRRDVVRWTLLDWLLLAYGLGWAAFGAAADVSGHQGLGIGDWGTVFGQLQFFLVFRGVRVGVRSVKERRTAIGVCLLSCLPVALLAILQELNAPGIRSLIQSMTGGISGAATVTANGSAIRATGPFDNWAALAGYLLPILLVLVATRMAGVNTRHRKWFIATAVFAAIALALTDEQSVILCLLVGLVVLFRQASVSPKVLRGAALGAVAVVVAAGPLIVSRIGQELASSAGTGRASWIPQTLSFRWTVWTDQYLPAIFAHPFSGYGVVLPSTIQWPFTESQYISFLTEGGFPMLVLFIALAAVMFSVTRRISRLPAVGVLEGAVARALAIAVVAMVVVDLVWPFLSNGGMPQVLWALLALAIPRQSPLEGPRHPRKPAWRFDDFWTSDRAVATVAPAAAGGVG